MPQRDRADPAERRGWLNRLPGVEPLGAVQLQRGDGPGPVVRFYRFGPLTGPWPRRYGPGALNPDDDPRR